MAYEICPICKREGVYYQPDTTRHLTTRYNCPTCGEFLAFMAEKIRDSMSFDEYRHLLSGAIRWHTDIISKEIEATEPIFISSVWVHDEFVKEKRVPWMRIPKSINDRTNMLLKWLVYRLKRIGVRDLIDIELLKAVCFASDVNEVQAIIVHLNGMNFTVGKYAGSDGYNISLTVDGWREFEKLGEVNEY